VQDYCGPAKGERLARRSESVPSGLELTKFARRTARRIRGGGSAPQVVKNP